jgi:molybdate transport system substrate-binding protein
MDSTEIQVLSAGAVKTGVRAAADAFRDEGRGDVVLRFATAPTLRAQIAEGASADVIVVPPGGMREISESGKIDDASRVMLGRVGAGVAVRDGAPVPDIGSVDSIKQALAEADSIAYNKASTGLYIEALFAQLGIAAALAGKIHRQDNGAAVMTHLLQHSGRAIGFGAITEILVFTGQGVRLVGPLPAEIQNYTHYEAAVMRQANNLAGAQAFVAFLGSPQGKRLLAQCGIEPVQP